MKLTRAKIKNYRTFGGEQQVDFGSGVNCIVGPNNCGKSNLFNALALALDPDALWQKELDLPSFMLGGRPPVPRLELTFTLEDRPGPERTLMRRAEAYERAVSGKSRTYAANGELRLAVTFAGGTPQRSFVALGAGARVAGAESPEYQRLYSQFREVLRFVMVRSGESLESLLAGRFREILHLVLTDHLRDQVGQADQARITYREALQTGLLVPLRERVEEVVGALFPEITAADLVPDLPSISHTLANVEVRLHDAAQTDMQGKGTGVRGAVLAAMLQYLADQTKRSMVFAVEEPEAFLHPAAQEELRGNLESLASRREVTLLVTTHSPFIVSRQAEARVIELRKDSKGRSDFVGVARGDESAVDRLGGLFRDSGLPRLIERALSVPATARAVVITEGYTDHEYLRIASTVAGRHELVDGIHFISADGASKVVLQSVLFQAATDLPVIALLDHDENGRVAREQLGRFQWSAKRNILMLNGFASCNRHDIEAEDLWPSELLDTILSELGEEVAVDGKTRCGKSWHFSVAKEAKTDVLEAIRSRAVPADATNLISLLEELNSRVAALA